MSNTAELVVLAVFSCGGEREREGREEGREEGRSHRRTGEAGSGLRWRGGDGTDINPSNACLSVLFLSSVSVLGLRQEQRRKPKDI